MTEFEQKLVGILQAAVQNKCSDIHFMTGSPPALRTANGVVPLQMPPITPEEMMAICNVMVADPKVKAKLHEIQDFDGSFEVKGVGRFRFNIYRNYHGYGAILRVIASKIPTIDELKLPAALGKIAEAERGLILVTGATGSGKSSTLAAMINHMNENSSLHILTVEDPIEFLHPQKKSRLTQREVGRDTPSFAVALKSALRQDPDVILIGEMRDLETLDIALKAAETGHVVFSTVHTSDAMKTIGRLLSLFPPEEQQAARMRLADNLHAIISQRLVPGIDGKTKVVAQEIMVSNFGIRECIQSEKRTGEIPGFIEKGQESSGMQTFDQHLVKLVRKELISIDVALAASSNPVDFQRNLAFGDTGIEDAEATKKFMGESLSIEEAPAKETAAPTATEAPKASAPAPASAKPAAPRPPMPMAPGATAAPSIPAAPGLPKVPKPPKAA